MYAIVRNGGRQFTAREGEVLELERIADKKPGDTVDFTDILLVSKSEGDVRASRLALCAATRKVLAIGLDLLGIEAPERM